MPTVTLVLDPETLRPVGLTDKDQRAYARFVRAVRELGRSCLSFSWSEPRSGPFHRRFFAMVGRAFEAQERFDDVDEFRMWLQVGAGFCDFLPHPTRGLIAVPKSIAYAKLEQGAFQEVADKVWAFFRSEHARGVLWPHLDGWASSEMVERVLEEFGE